MTRPAKLSAPLFDSHCHFDFPVFDENRQALWQACVDKQIKHLLIPGVEPKQWPALKALMDSYPDCFMAAGIHPWHARQAQWSQNTAEQLQDCLSHRQCIAVGECGLDKLVAIPFEQQMFIFEQQLALACEFKRPLIIHARKSHNETITLLKHYRPPAGGVIHAFSGSLQLAQQYWAMGFLLGIGGTITYPRANKTRATVTQMPLEALILETDAPDMPVSGEQGKTNSPLQLITIAETLASLREASLDNIAQATTHNAYALFAL